MTDRISEDAAAEVKRLRDASRAHQVETAARREAAIEARERAIDFREQMAHEREASVLDREARSDARDASGVMRDALADERDVFACERDEAARARDSAATMDESDVAPSFPPAMLRFLTEDRAHAASDRRRAAADRRRASDDRAHSRDDRDAAGHDRRSWSHERASDNLDGLTGALRRGPGLIELAREITVAREAGDDLVLGFVDVVGLKAVNDSRGHHSGDAVLVEVVAALRAHIRPSDAVVRLGGDEFLVILGRADLAVAGARLTDVHGMLADSTMAASVTIGLAQLEKDDTGESLMARADSDLYLQRNLAVPGPHEAQGA